MESFHYPTSSDADGYVHMRPNYPALAKLIPNIENFRSSTDGRKSKKFDVGCINR